jgi:hypothetical protein
MANEDKYFVASTERKLEKSIWADGVFRLVRFNTALEGKVM